MRDIPDEIFVLPVRTNTGDLEDEDTIVFEQVVNILEESVVATDTDMLQDAISRVSETGRHC
jgi:hypothetical protein